MRVKFTEDYLYETEGRNKGPTFKTGEVHDFRDDIAQRFIRRGVAVKHDGMARPERPTAPPPPPSGGKVEKPDGGKGEGGKS